MTAAQKSWARQAAHDDAQTSSDAGRDKLLRQQLQQGLDDLSLSLPAYQQELLIQYVALLLRWNAVYNLTAVRDPHEMLALHLLDSLSIVELVANCEGLDVLDVGTGAGLPGIPLAITLPQHRLLLVDAVAKKISFLQQVKTSLKLSNIHPQHARIEALTLCKFPSVIVSRAYADLSHMVHSIDRLAEDSTTVIAMKGVNPGAEIVALPPSWKVVEVRDLHVPFLGAKRCAVVLRRAP